MAKVLSAWGVVYYFDKKSGQPMFLLVKRFALSKKVERVAPKWKIQRWEMVVLCLSAPCPYAKHTRINGY